MKTFFKWLDKIENVFAAIGMWVIAFMMGLVVFEVIIRNLFNYSFSWSIDYTSYALLYIAFLGAAWLLREGGHVSVNILEEYLPAKSLKFLDYIIVISGILLSLVLVYYGIGVTWDLYINDTRSLSVVKTPLAYVVMIIPIGGLLLLLEFFRKGYLLVTVKVPTADIDKVRANANINSNTNINTDISINPKSNV
ncbi:TRAP transporter small permease [Bacillus tuaregi]|uniref:TRAP transporter small permease n=1 Tax=Bacillus tuaregi TaxID=1816695 RepID=UPI0008F8E1D0|nr:TRAP transporter small permease [Bacillus tuaregi]